MDSRLKLPDIIMRIINHDANGYLDSIELFDLAWEQLHIAANMRELEAHQLENLKLLLKLIFHISSEDFDADYTPEDLMDIYTFKDTQGRVYRMMFQETNGYRVVQLYIFDRDNPNHPPAQLVYTDCIDFKCNLEKEGFSVLKAVIQLEYYLLFKLK